MEKIIIAIIVIIVSIVIKLLKKKAKEDEEAKQREAQAVARRRAAEQKTAKQRLSQANIKKDLENKLQDFKKNIDINFSDPDSEKIKTPKAIQTPPVKTESYIPKKESVQPVKSTTIEKITEIKQAVNEVQSINNNATKAADDYEKKYTDYTTDDFYQSEQIEVPEEINADLIFDEFMAPTMFTLEPERKFAPFRHKEIVWNGKLDRIEPLVFDSVFGSKKGFKAFINIPVSGNATDLVKQTLTVALHLRKNEQDLDKLKDVNCTVSGKLFAADTYGKIVYVSNGSIILN